MLENTKKPVLTKAEVLECGPEFCVDCDGKVEYWGETEEEVIFECVKCKRKYTIPLDPNKLAFYFSY